MPARRRITTPREDYPGTLAALRALVDGLIIDAGVARDHLPGVGIGIPGSLSPATRAAFLADNSARVFGL